MVSHFFSILCNVGWHISSNSARVIFLYFFFCVLIIFLFLRIFYWLCYYSCSNFSSFAPSNRYPHSLQQSPLSSCSWVMYMRSLASAFPILFLTPHCLFYTYQLCFLIPSPFLPFCPFPLPPDNPPNDLPVYDSDPVLVVCLGLFVLFCF